MGQIERRVLLDHVVEPDVAAEHLPPGFEPRLLHGQAIVGVCLIRLVAMRPAGLPACAGVAVEAAAHRISVVRVDDGQRLPGVFVPRRDTPSRVGVAAGGRVWPGVHGQASIDVRRTEQELSIAMAARDGATVSVDLDLDPSRQSVPGAVALADPEAFSAFHRAEVTAWSPGRRGQLEAAELVVAGWDARTVAVRGAASSWIDDESAFPPGSAALAGALLMAGLAVRWRVAR